MTFDDGPDPRSTPAFLELLTRHDVRATFFVLGRMLARNPGLGRDLVDAGHELAVHGWDHRCAVLRRPRATAEQIRRTCDLILDVTGTAPRWYRPPYGVLAGGTRDAATRLGLTSVLWTVWGRDWTARATPATVITSVGRRPIGGATILLHDSDCTSAPGSWRTTLAALPLLLDSWQDAGFRVGPLAEHGLLAR